MLRLADALRVPAHVLLMEGVPGDPGSAPRPSRRLVEALADPGFVKAVETLARSVDGSPARLRRAADVVEAVFGP